MLASHIGGADGSRLNLAGAYAAKGENGGFNSDSTGHLGYGTGSGEEYGWEEKNGRGPRDPAEKI